MIFWVRSKPTWVRLIYSNICLIAVDLVDVDLQYWTSKVEHRVSFTAIYSNMCNAHAQKRLFINFRYKFIHHRSIRRPRFPVSVQNFGYLATFSFNFCVLYWMSAIFLLLVCLTYWPRNIRRPHVDNSHPLFELRMYYLFIDLLVCVHWKSVCLHWKNHRFTAFLDSKLHTRLAIVTINELGLAFPPRNLPKKFRPDPSTFYLVIVATDRQTDRLTNVRRWKHNPSRKLSRG